MDLSFLMVFSTNKSIDPTGRQNFGDAPGQIPKLILTLCHISFYSFMHSVSSMATEKKEELNGAGKSSKVCPSS